MDLEQLQKRLQWIEDERRKEKDTLALLESRVLAYEGGLAAANQQIKDISGEVTRLASIVTRMDQYDQNLLQARMEAKRLIEEIDKENKLRLDELEKLRRVEFRALESNLVELGKELDILPKYEKAIQASAEENIRIRRSIDELANRITEARRDEEETTRTYRLLEDGRRQDSKRLIDLQGEVTALRKRADDQRGQTELLGTNLRKLDTRLTELAAVETERRDAMSAFLDKQALGQVERERTWKEWQARFETVDAQVIDVQSKIQNLDSMNRDAKRMQSVLDDLIARVERRINEITEIQRLSEDRFRQEWVTFRGDDQKRWTNYSLTQEEQHGEVLRQFEKLTERTTHLEDELQDLQDMLQQVTELSEKRVQSLLALAHEWVSSHERTIGRTR
jgi:chromosome segregation ATPase